MIVHVSIPAKDTIPREQVKKALDDAFRTFDYVRFKLSNGIYVIVSYQRDRSVVISTNSRDLAFFSEYQAVMKMPTQLRLTDLICRWINKL